MARPRGRPLRAPGKVTPPINENIRAAQVRLIDEQGENVGVVARAEALARAERADLDLVLVASGDVPVCRLQDYSRQRYLDQKHKRETRAKSAKRETKVIQFRVRIGEHDYAFKRDHVIKFLTAGLRVQAQIFFRGREQSHPDLGYKILERLVEDVRECGSANLGAAQREGRLINLTIEPLAKS